MSDRCQYAIALECVEIFMLYRHIMIDMSMPYKSRYYELMQQVTEAHHWEEWNLFMLAAVEETARWTSEKIRAIRKLLSHTAEFVRNRLPRIYSKELVELIFAQPYCRIANVVDAGISKRQTASVYLKELVDIGLLREQPVGRDKVFLYPKFLQLLMVDENGK